MRNTQDSLDLLQEEAAELIQAISKIRRFGLQARNPLVENSPTNLENFVQEMADVQTLIDIVIEQTDLPITHEMWYVSRERKIAKLEKYLSHE
jgi:NTP pyrophosphatase (non-canonical NTP hydrolase)